MLVVRDWVMVRRVRRWWRVSIAKGGEGQGVSGGLVVWGEGGGEGGETCLGR